jgi:hypothetical protein
MTNIGSGVRHHMLFVRPIDTDFCAASKRQHSDTDLFSGRFAHYGVCFFALHIQSLNGLLSILTCTQWVVASGGMLDVEYTKGGRPVIFMSSASLQGSGICGTNATYAQTNLTGGAGDPQMSKALLILFSFILGLFWPVIHVILY